MTEVIVPGRGATFYAGDLRQGDIFQGDLQRGTAELFINAPQGRMAMGMAADVVHNLLFVAGGFTGQGYIYDIRSGITVASYQFGDPDTSLVNDVALTDDGACYTESWQARLYFVPVSQAAGSRRQRSAPWPSAVQRPPSARSAGGSTLTASRPPPTARPWSSRTRSMLSCTRWNRPPGPAQPSPG